MYTEKEVGPGVHQVFVMAPRLHLRCQEGVVDTYSTPRWIRRGTTGRQHTRRLCVTDSQLSEPGMFGGLIGGLVFIGSFGGSVGVHPRLRLSDPAL